MSDPSTIPITALTGPPFIIIVIIWALFGVLSTQVHVYSKVFPNDRPALKGLVYGVYVLQLAQTLLQTETSWSLLVSGFGNISGMDEIGMIWVSVCIIGGFVTLLVQWFYAYRIAVISQRNMIPTVITLLAATSFAGALGTAVVAEHAGQFTTLLAHHESQTFATLGLWGAASTVCDILITICMWYYLRRQTCGGFPKTQALVSRIIRLTVETGAVTTSVSILTLILYFPPSFIDLGYYKAPLSTSANFYAVTMLAVLNSRKNYGMSSESMTWHQDEQSSSIPDADVSSTREMVNLKLDCESSPGSSRSAKIFVTKEGFITTD